MLLSAISEPVVGAAVVRSYAVEARTQERIDTAIAAHQAAATRAQGFTAFSFSLGGISAGLANAGVLIVGIWLGQGRLGPRTSRAGEVLAFAFLVTLFVGPVQLGTQVLTDAQNAIAGWRRVIGILDTPADLVDPGPDGQVLPAGAIDVAFARRRLRLPGRPAGAARHRPRHPGRHPGGGGRRDRVGQVDAGQAADPADGSDRGPGAARRRRRARHHRDLAAVAAWCWCRRRASSSTTPSPQRALRPARRDRRRDRRRGRGARPGRLARGAPDGLATRVGQRGESLSAGERQLVALLRAQLADPDLLVLDEATSAVDPALEIRIGRALDRLMSGRTSVTIAHRMSTAESADEVVVVDRGRIVQRGPHADLVREDGFGLRRTARRPGWPSRADHHSGNGRVTSLDPAIAARLSRNDAGLVPAIVQQHDTGEVLMLAWMDDEALHRTPHHRPGDVLEPLAAGVLGQGRDLRQPAAREGDPARLRRRHPAGQGRPGGAGLPHRRPAPASTTACCRSR